MTKRLLKPTTVLQLNAGGSVKTNSPTVLQLNAGGPLGKVLPLHTPALYFKDLQFQRQRHWWCCGWMAGSLSKHKCGLCLRPGM